MVSPISFSSIAMTEELQKFSSSSSSSMSPISMSQTTQGTPSPSPTESMLSSIDVRALSPTLSQMSISPAPLRGRVSPYKEVLEKSLEYYSGCSDHAIAVSISDIIDLIVSISDSFLIEDLPDSWKKRFALIQDKVTPTRISKIKFKRLSAVSRRDLVQVFPKLAPLFPLDGFMSIVKEEAKEGKGLTQ